MSDDGQVEAARRAVFTYITSYEDAPYFNEALDALIVAVRRAAADERVTHVEQTNQNLRDDRDALLGRLAEA